MKDREEHARLIGEAITDLLGEDEGFVFAIFPFNTRDADIDMVSNCDEEGLAQVMEALNESIRLRGSSEGKTLN